MKFSINLSQMLSESVFALDQMFTFNSLFFVQKLFCDNKPLASWLPLNSFV